MAMGCDRRIKPGVPLAEKLYEITASGEAMCPLRSKRTCPQMTREISAILASAACVTVYVSGKSLKTLRIVVH